MIKKQFALRNGRRNSSGDASVGIVTAASLLDKQLIQNARVKAADATGTKIRGLTLTLRETYLSSFLDALNTNYENCRQFICEGNEKKFTKADILDCAVQVEYNIFTNNTVLSIYRQKGAMAVSLKVFCHLIVTIKLT